jgi:riboflavin biosynthesis pyrimidine reductase
VFTRGQAPVIVLATGRAKPSDLGRLRKVADCVAVFGSETIDWKEALAWLRREWGVRRLLCEGGAELNGSLLRAGVVHELHLTVCPYIFGGRDAPTIADGLPGLPLDRDVRCRLRSASGRGAERFLVYDVEGRESVETGMGRPAGIRAP